jgi:hypothetical protein
VLVRCCHTGLPLRDSMLVCKKYWHMFGLASHVTNSFVQKEKLCFTLRVDLSSTSLLMYHSIISFKNHFTMMQHSGLLGLVAIRVATTATTVLRVATAMDGIARRRNPPPPPQRTSISSIHPSSSSPHASHL